MSLTVEQTHAKMDEAYREFMIDFQDFLHKKIVDLGDQFELPTTSVLTVTGRALTELGAMDLLVGLGGKPITEQQGAALDFSNKILACVILAARGTLKKLEVEIQ